MVPALLLGIILGWQLQRARQRRVTGPQPASAASAFHRLKSNQGAGDAHADLDEMEREAAALQSAIAKARQRLGDLDREHARLLQEISGREDLIGEDRRTVESLRQSRESRQDQVLADIDLGGEEIEMVGRLRNPYTARINRLSQKLDDRNTELESLRATHDQMLDAIDEARGMLRAKQDEYERLMHELQVREDDLSRIQAEVAEQSAALRTLVAGEHDAARGDGLRVAPFRETPPRDESSAERPRLTERANER